MIEQLEHAIRLREAGRAEEARDLLIQLQAAHPGDPAINNCSNTSVPYCSMLRT
jgi:hypothetical protein